MKDLCVILPIYNVETYLLECLYSIEKALNNVLDLKIKIYLINDGSTDNSNKIAKEFALNYSNFFYYDKENGGLGDARNYGLNVSNEEYILFVDSDDKIHENIFNEIAIAIQTNPDLIIFDWYDYYTEKLAYVTGMDVDTELWTVQASAWNKVYHRKLFNSIRYPKRMVFEDVGTTYRILGSVETYIYIPKALYFYRREREGSLLNSNNSKINHIYNMLDLTYNYYKDKGLHNNPIIYNGLCYQYIKLLMWSNMYRQLKYYKFNFYEFYTKMKSTRNEIYSKFPDWKQTELILQYPEYFISRLGNNYIKYIDDMGRNLHSTFFSVTKVVIKNINR